MLVAVCFAFFGGVVHAQVQSKDQSKCTMAMNKSLVKIFAAQGKKAGKCMQGAAKGVLVGTVEDCLAGVAGDKVDKASVKTQEKFDKLCTGTTNNDPTPRLPPYGVSDAPSVNLAASAEPLESIRSVFGDDLAALFVDADTDKDGTKCKLGVAKGLTKCADALIKAFLKCKAAGLKDETTPIDGADDLEACLGDDPKGLIAKRCDLMEEKKPGKFKLDGIRKALAKCEDEAVDLAAALPGCAPGDADAAHACAMSSARCHVCEALNRADDLAVDCDAFDDGMSASCGGPVIGRHQCAIDPASSGFLFDTSIFADIFPLDGTIDIDCGAVDPLSGRAPCTCNAANITPFPIIGGAGFACVGSSSGCPDGEITCNGGDLFNGTMTSDHNIGACTSNADCAAQCQATCSTATADVFDSGCEGFCRGGLNDDQPCSDDGGCPDGTCNGLDNTAHGNICQCECLDTSGDPALPGALRCSLGIVIDVELALPCDGSDILFSVGERCVPFTTETTTGMILDADNVPNAEIPAAAQNIFTGIPVACPDLMANGASGMSLTSEVNVFDVEIAGDIAFHFVLECL
jgi:hypothetical protein